MDRPLSQSLRATFLVHMIVAGIFGLALWLIPGRTLTWVGWVPVELRLPEYGISAPGTVLVDPAITRVLGAALLALAFSSFRGWRARKWTEVALLVQQEAVFCVVGVIALMPAQFFLNRGLAPFGWVCVAVLAAFALAWGLALQRQRR